MQDSGDPRTGTGAGSWSHQSHHAEVPGAAPLSARLQPPRGLCKANWAPGQRVLAHWTSPRKWELTFEARRLTESPGWVLHSGVPGEVRVFIVLVSPDRGAHGGNWLKGISWQESPPAFKRQQIQERPNLLIADRFLGKHHRLSYCWRENWNWEIPE